MRNVGTSWVTPSRTGSKMALDRASIMSIVAVLSFVTIPVIPSLFYDLFTPDESMLLIYPARILAGQWPNRDFFNAAYGPGQFWILAGIYKILGSSVITERLLGWVLHVAIAFGVVRITWFRGRFVAATSGCASAFILSLLGLPAYAWLGGLSLVIWSMAITVRGNNTRRTFAIAGILVGMAFAIRPDLGPTGVLCQLPLLWRSQFKREWLFGFSLGLLPIVIHLIMAGSAFVRNFSMVIRASRAGFMVPPNVPIALHVAVLLLTASVLALAWTAFRERDPIHTAVTMLCLLLLPQAFQRTDLTHIADVGCVIWPMWIAFVFYSSTLANEMIHRYGARWLRNYLSVAALVLMGATLIMAVASWKEPFWIRHLGNSIPVRDARTLQQTEALMAATNRHVPPGGRIFVGAVDMSSQNYTPMYLYVLLTEYRAQNYYLEFPGNFENAGEVLSKDIRQSDALLLSDTPELRREVYRSRPKRPSEANDAVARYFCSSGRYGYVYLYIRCRA